MALERVTMLDRIEATAVGGVQVRLQLLIVDNGTNIVARRYHRLVIMPEDDAASVIEEVNTHLVGMGELPVSLDDIARIVAHVDTDKTVPGRKAFARALLVPVKKE